MRQRVSGFTIVELLIVIVVIAILAAIVIVAYNGVQGRARDSRRLQDAETIVKALEAYKVTHGNYPPAVSTAGAAGWEVSTNGTSATNFLSALVSSTDGVSKIPVDPVNTGVVGDLSPASNKNNFEYFYYRYGAGEYGCDALRGEYYVFGITRLDGVASGQNSAASPGFSCSGRNWAYEGAWATGNYTN
jgi:prepilin-type N-terminal cleavage/methylation domain-containing protein